MVPLLLLLSSTAATNITICIVEEQTYHSSENSTVGATSLDNVSALLRSRLTDIALDVSLAHYAVSAPEFPFVSLTACEFLNSSCAGVVTLAPCDHVQYMHDWATEHVIPHVIVSQTSCKGTSSHPAQTMTQPRTDHRLLQQLLVHLGWTHVAIIVDSRSVAGLVKQLSDVYMGTIMFRLFDHHDNNTQAHLQHVQRQLNTMKDSLFFNILVVASNDTASFILREKVYLQDQELRDTILHMYSYPDHAQKIGLLSRDHFWVIALPDSLCSDLMEGVIVEGSNILVVQPLPSGVKESKATCRYKSAVCEQSAKTDNADVTRLAETVEVLVRSAVKTGFAEHAHNVSENSSICENSTCALNRRSAVSRALNETQTANNRWTTDSTSYSICSTDSDSPKGLVSVGRWSQYSGLELSEGPAYRNTFRDFGYRTLKVGTQDAKPFVQKKGGNGTQFEGFCVDILNELALALKFKYEFVEPPDGEWGAPADDKGNWTGIIQQVLRKEVDFGIGPFTITSIREDVIDFTKPFMEDGVGILTQRPDSDAKNMFKMFTPLTPQVWGAVAGAVVLVSVCLYCIERSSPFSARNLDGDRKLGMLGSFWLIYGSYMEQGGDPHPRSVSARCLVGFWWLFTILMTSTYTANLAAFLTVTIEDSPVNSLSELSMNSDLKPLVKAGSNVRTLFREAEGGVYQDVWHKMSGMPTVKSNDEALDYVLDGTYAYMTDNSQLEYIMLKDCTTYSLAKELFNTGGFGFVLQEDSPYMDVINYNIMKMQEAGLMDKWRQRWWSSPDPCTSSGRTSAAKELDWPSLSGLFYIFLGVASVSVLLRILEFFLHGDKLLQIWKRLKSKVRRSASVERGAGGTSCMCSVGSEDSVNTQCTRCSTSSGIHRNGARMRSSLGSHINGTVKLELDGKFAENNVGNGEDLNGFLSVCLDSVEDPNRLGNGGFGSLYDNPVTDKRGSEFQDFDSGNRTYWELGVQTRASARRKSSDIP
ncbi:glutamate receptor ionotropic, kainate 3-like [Littorina saxatilis]|uniref:glutamate receptor ionotropic, kainate 3-like n=1 Tax=Littorina saxatilis TaxID=31220 RepID=UPI0038B4BBF2